MKLLDLYVLKRFLGPFLYCLIGFIAIWLIFDIADNLQDFLESRASAATLRNYYLTQVPEVIVMSLPVSCLLATLYCFSQMSRKNELVAMLMAGISVWRIVLPILLLGALCTAVVFYLNYEKAPHASAARQQLKSDIKRGKRLEKQLVGHVFVNHEDRRLWFVRSMFPSRGKLWNIAVYQEDENGILTEKFYGTEVDWNPVSGNWHIKDFFYVRLDEQGNEIQNIWHPSFILEGWSETPWRIASSVLQPDYLSVPELREYLQKNASYSERRLAPYRTNLHYRYSLPMASFIAVLLAAPLSISLSRRQFITHIALAIGLFFSMVFLNSITLAMGKGSHIPPFVAAWSPILLFAAIGFALLWFRSSNREIPALRFAWL